MQSLADAIAQRGRAGLQLTIHSFDRTPLTALIAEQSGIAFMAADLLVRSHSRAHATFKLAQGDGMLPGGGDDEPLVQFVDMPWEEAIREWKKRGRVTENDLERLIRQVAHDSDEASRLLLERVQERTLEHLETALRDGKTYEKFAEDLRGGLVPLGITADDDAYLQTVFRTNVQSAYGAGRYIAITDPEVVAERPYVQYLTVGDGFVRPSHAKLHGKVFRVDSSEWRAIAPPNGFNCRCGLVSLTAEQAEGEDVLASPPEGSEPDEGFAGPPTASGL